MNNLNNLENKISNWLKFAEAKVLALITFNSIQFPIILQSVFNIESTFTYKQKIILIIICIINIIFIVLSISATPNNHKILNLNICFQKKEEYNLLYFLDIYSYVNRFSLKCLTNQYINLFNINVDQDNKLYLRQKIKQIYQLSAIATLKYKLFNISIYITTLFILIYICFNFYNLL